MDLQVATTIRQQLFAFGKIKVWSWGANSWTGDKDSLTFKVQGHLFKGVVKITLKGNDTYTIEFFKTRSAECVKTYEGIYFDQMTDLIDEYVERIPEYKH